MVKVITLIIYTHRVLQHSLAMLASGNMEMVKTLSLILSIFSLVYFISVPVQLVNHFLEMSQIADEVTSQVSMMIMLIIAYSLFWTQLLVHRWTFDPVQSVSVFRKI